MRLQSAASLLASVNDVATPYAPSHSALTGSKKLATVLVVLSPIVTQVGWESRPFAAWTVVAVDRVLAGMNSTAALASFSFWIAAWCWAQVWLPSGQGSSAAPTTF